MLNCVSVSFDGTSAVPSADGRGVGAPAQVLGVRQLDAVGRELLPGCGRPAPAQLFGVAVQARAARPGRRAAVVRADGGGPLVQAAVEGTTVRAARARQRPSIGGASAGW